MNEYLQSGSNTFASHAKQSGLSKFMSFFSDFRQSKKIVFKHDKEFFEKVKETVSEELTNPELSTGFWQSAPS